MWHRRAIHGMLVDCIIIIIILLLLLLLLLTALLSTRIIVRTEGNPL